jgi:hypothetical protein
MQDRSIREPGDVCVSGAHITRADKSKFVGATHVVFADLSHLRNPPQALHMKVVSIGLMLFLALMACGCAHLGDDEELVSRKQSAPAANDAPLQCVPYARDHSGIRIFGDAYTWWDQAAGRYVRSSLPREKAVIVFIHYAGNQRGHVAVVRQIISAREIRIDHANWFDDGKIYVNDPIEDISVGNDWSLVRVWNMRMGFWGKAYDVRGFIWPTSPNDRVSALFLKMQEPAAH